jgi:hypothetical protein
MHTSVHRPPQHAPSAILRRTTGILFVPWMSPKPSQPEPHVQTIHRTSLLLQSALLAGNRTACMCMYCQQHRLQTTARTGRAHCGRLHRRVCSDKLCTSHWQQGSATSQTNNVQWHSSILQKPQPSSVQLQVLISAQHTTSCTLALLMAADDDSKVLLPGDVACSSQLLPPAHVQWCIFINCAYSKPQARRQNHCGAYKAHCSGHKGLHIQSQHAQPIVMHFRRQQPHSQQ